MLGAIGFAAAFRLPSGSHGESLKRAGWRRWDARLLLLLLAVAAALGFGALQMLDVPAPDARFWQLYGVSLVVTLGGSLAACCIEQTRTRAWSRSMWRTLAILAGILVAGAVLRLYRLSDLPFGLWYDEAANGLEALRVANEPQYQPVYTDGVNASGHYLYLIVAAFEAFGVSAHSIRLVKRGDGDRDGHSGLFGGAACVSEGGSVGCGAVRRGALVDHVQPSGHVQHQYAAV